jgi:hypothetical protein
MSHADAGRFVLALSIAAYVTAIMELIYPEVPDGSGRWGWLKLFFYENFGIYGMAALWGMVGTVLLVSYFRHRAKS